MASIRKLKGTLGRTGAPARQQPGRKSFDGRLEAQKWLAIPSVAPGKTWDCLNSIKQAAHSQDQLFVEEVPPIEHPLQRLRVTPCAFVGADARKGVKYVAHSAYTNRQTQLIGSKAKRIAASVQGFMVKSADFKNQVRDFWILFKEHVAALGMTACRFR